MLLPRAQESHAKVIAAITAAANLAVAVVMFAGFEQLAGALQCTERVSCVEASDAGFGVQYFVGVDGLSATLMLLTGFLFLVATLVSWNVSLRPREYYAWLMVLQTAV